MKIPDWYGRLDVDAPPMTEPPRPATDTWLVLLENFLNTSRGDDRLAPEALETRSEILQRFPDASSYEFLPVLFVNCKKPDIQKLIELPRVRFAFSVAIAHTDYQPILSGVNALMSETFHQLFNWREHISKGGHLPDADFEGGLWPAGAYPTATGAEADNVQRASTPAWMPVVNFSQGPKIIESASNPVLLTLATVAETHMVVVAAGNDGCKPVPKLNTWAPQGPGVLRVGASEDANGMLLAAYSSCGSATSPGSGPDLVAWGKSPRGDEGTSYAAPRVAKLGCFASAALFQVHRLLNELRGHGEQGTPLMGWGLIDYDEPGSRAIPPRSGLNALPLLGPNNEAWSNAHSAFQRLGKVPSLSFAPGALTKMIKDSARPMTGYRPHEVGAGFIDEDQLVTALGRLSIGRYLSYFLDPKQVESLSPKVAALPAFEVDGLRNLAEVVRGSRPIWFYDYRKGEFAVNNPSGVRRLGSRPAGHAYEVMLAGTQPSVFIGK